MNNLEVKTADISEIEKIYEKYMREDFPPDELKPLRYITKAVSEGWYKVYLFYDRCIKAYAFVASCGDNIAFLDYFAVLTDYRGEGIGSEAFKKLSELPDVKYIVFEVESVETAKNSEDETIRKKRIDFYTRNGAVKTHGKYNVFGVEYDIMINKPLEMTKDLSEEACLQYENAYKMILKNKDTAYMKRVL